jgi:pimeloyl-ACP methyl ester carboxylesterase
MTGDVGFMTIVASLVRAIDPDAKPMVIALHCSGATGSEWRELERQLGNRFSLSAPDLIGCGSNPHWTGGDFGLSDEAAHIVHLIDSVKRPVHLVGHSYGGAVAIRVALERPAQVASLSLYEPVAFHILKISGIDGKAALEKITGIADTLRRFVLSGDHDTAAMLFVEFWNGEGSWTALRKEARAELARYIPKICLEFSATLDERTPFHSYRRFNFPVLLLHGEHAPESTKIISQQLAKAMKYASLQSIYGAGHMGPISHASAVGAMIRERIVRTEPSIPADERDIASNFDLVA